MAIRLTKRERDKIDKLRKRKGSLVFRKGRKLTKEETTDRNRNIEREIAGIQSRGRVTPRGSNSGSSTQNNGFMDQLRLNTGGFVPNPPPTPKTIPRNLGDLGNNQRVIPNTDLMEQLRLNTGGFVSPSPLSSDYTRSTIDFGAGNLGLPSDPQVGQSTDQFTRNNIESYTPPQFRTSRTPPGLLDLLRQDTGGFISSVPELRSRRPTLGLLDLLRENTGGFLSNSQQQGSNFTPRDTLPSEMEMNFLEYNKNNNIENRQKEQGFGFDLFGNPSNMGISTTVGDLRRGIFDQLALNTGLFSDPRQQFTVPVGGFGNFIQNRMLQGKLNEANENRNINAFIDPNLPPSTATLTGQDVNLTSSPRAVEYDIYGNPRNFGPGEIINRFGSTIDKALAGNNYTIV